jgi:electron transfer flavoprotein alpha subunit
MTRSLVVVADDDMGPDGTAGGLITIAAGLTGPVTLGIVSTSSTPGPSEAPIAGVDRVVTVRVSGGDRRPDMMELALRELLARERPAAVLMNFSWDTASFAAAVAHSLDLGFAADVLQVEREADGTIVAQRAMYGGKVLAEIEIAADTPALLLVRSSVTAAAADSDTTTPTETTELDVTAEVGPVRHVGFVQPPTGDVDLTRENVILAVGRGVGSRENVEVFASLARRLGVALGASRPVVDMGWLPSQHQIGQSGVNVAPALYIGFGISGALQHMTGMRASERIVAVNTDPDAPIFAIAHDGAHEDAMAVAEALEKLLDD